MIRYTLDCEAGHSFEAWFRSSADFEAQRERGLLSCAVCGSPRVGKALMAPSIAKGDAKGAPAGEAVPAAPEQPEQTARPAAILSENEVKLRAMLRELRAELTRNATDVGARFADEARKMHYGETERASIYGETTLEEARALLEEGVEVHPLPIVPDDRN